MQPPARTLWQCVEPYHAALLGIIRPLAVALAASGTIPFPNPIGVPPVDPD